MKIYEQYKHNEIPIQQLMAYKMLQFWYITSQTNSLNPILHHRHVLAYIRIHYGTQVTHQKRQKYCNLFDHQPINKMHAAAAAKEVAT